MRDTVAADRRRKFRLIFIKLCSRMRRAWSPTATRPRVCERRKHEDDCHDGGNRSHRIFCGFFRRAPCSDKERTDISGTLLPVLRSRNGLQLYKPRAMPCNGCRHRWQLRTARWRRSIWRSSGAQVTSLRPTVVGPKCGRARGGFASSGQREVIDLKIDRPPTGAAQKGKPPKGDVSKSKQGAAELVVLTSQLISRRGLFRILRPNFEHSPMRIANPFVVIIHVIGSLRVIHNFAQHQGCSPRVLRHFSHHLNCGIVGTAICDCGSGGAPLRFPVVRLM